MVGMACYPRPDPSHIFTFSLHDFYENFIVRGKGFPNNDIVLPCTQNHLIILLIIDHKKTWIAAQIKPEITRTQNRHYSDYFASEPIKPIDSKI